MGEAAVVSHSARFLYQAWVQAFSQTGMLLTAEQHVHIQARLRSIIGQLQSGTLSSESSSSSRATQDKERSDEYLPCYDRRDPKESSLHE